MRPDPLKFVVMHAAADEQAAAWIRSALQDLGCLARLLPYAEPYPTHSVRPEEYVLLVLSERSGNLPLMVDPFVATRIPVPIDETPIPPMLAMIEGIYLNKARGEENGRRILAEAVRSLLRPRREFSPPQGGGPPFPGRS